MSGEVNKPSTSQNSDSNGEEGPNLVQEFKMPTPEEIAVQDLMNNCLVKSALSGVMGGVAGVFFGMFFGSLEQPLHQDTMTTRQILVHGFKNMGIKSYQTGKTFAVMGAIFSGAECVVEKARARHDIVNPAMAGCVTGAFLSRAGGAKAACFGCAGFAAFSVVIEKVMERYQH